EDALCAATERRARLEAGDFDAAADELEQISGRSGLASQESLAAKDHARKCTERALERRAVDGSGGAPRQRLEAFVFEMMPIACGIGGLMLRFGRCGSVMLRMDRCGAALLRKLRFGSVRPDGRARRAGREQQRGAGKP